MKNDCRLWKYFIVIVAVTFFLPLRAQMPQRSFLSWDDFLAEYADFQDSDDGAGDDNLWEEEVDRLEQMASHPLQ